MSVIKSMTNQQLLELSQQARAELNTRDGGHPDFSHMNDREFHMYTIELGREQERNKQESERLERAKLLQAQEPTEDE